MSPHTTNPEEINHAVTTATQSSTPSSSNTTTQPQSQHARLQSEIDQLTSTIAHTRAQLVETLLRLGEITGTTQATQSESKSKSTLVSSVPPLSTKDDDEDGKESRLQPANMKEIALSLPPPPPYRELDGLSPPPSVSVQHNDDEARTSNPTAKGPVSDNATSSSSSLQQSPPTTASVTVSNTPTSQIPQRPPQQQHRQGEQQRQRQQRQRAMLQQAESILARHVALLQRYNATKDSALTLLTCVADARGVPVAEVRREFTSTSITINAAGGDGSGSGGNGNSRGVAGFDDGGGGNGVDIGDGKR